MVVGHIIQDLHWPSQSPYSNPIGKSVDQIEEESLSRNKRNLKFSTRVSKRVSHYKTVLLFSPGKASGIINCTRCQYF